MLAEQPAQLTLAFPRRSRNPITRLCGNTRTPAPAVASRCCSCFNLVKVRYWKTSGVMAIRSKGRDGTATITEYSVTSFEPTDYDQDIVWADGFMVRWPTSRKPAGSRSPSSPRRGSAGRRRWR